MKEFVSAVRQYRSTFALVSGAVFIVGLTLILSLPGEFKSSTRLMVTIEGSTTATAYQNEEIANRRINSYIPLLTSTAVTQRVVDRLQLPMTASELAKKITATNVPAKSTLIDIEVSDGSPEKAQQIADAVAAEFILYAAAIETPTGEDNQEIHTTVVSAATAGHQYPFKRVLLSLLAAFAALLVGAVAVWIRSTKKSAVSPPDEDETKTDDTVETVDPADT